VFWAAGCYSIAPLIKIKRCLSRSRSSVSCWMWKFLYII